MKLRTAHIASLFFLASLLFAQVAVNFFHRNHDVHENKSITAPLRAGEAGVQKHDEHCQVCAIDFFNHSFIASVDQFFESAAAVETKSAEAAHPILPYPVTQSDRAPPTFS